MFTGPWVRVCLAMIGYEGCGRLSTFDFSMTEVTRCVVGGFTGGSGGGGVLSTVTVGGPLLPEHDVQVLVIGGPPGSGSEICGACLAFGGAGGTRFGAALIRSGGVRGLSGLS